MTIEQKGVIDFISTDVTHNVANLVACDHLEWNDGELDEHLLKIQDKINEYLSFIEGGNLFEVKPELQQMRLVLKVVGKYEPPQQAVQFCEAMQQELARTAIRLFSSRRQRHWNNFRRRGARTFGFDQGNPVTSAAGKATYGYDGLGHRVSMVGTDGVHRVPVYSQGGQLLYTLATSAALAGAPVIKIMSFFRSIWP